MKDKRKIIHSRKAFLNKDGFHSDANIVAYLATHEDETNYSLSSELAIKDCHAKIHLSIDLYDDKSYKNTIFKLNKLIDELILYKAACENGRQWYIEVEKRVEERIKLREAKRRTEEDPEPPVRRFTRRVPGRI